MNINYFVVTGDKEGDKKIEDKVILKLVKFNYNNIHINAIEGSLDCGNVYYNEDQYLKFIFSNGDKLKYTYNFRQNNEHLKKIAYENCLITSPDNKKFRIRQIAIGEEINSFLIDKILNSYIAYKEKKTVFDKRLGNDPKSTGFSVISIETIKSDNSGPWATTGTSIDRYIIKTKKPRLDMYTTNIIKKSIAKSVSLMDKEIIATKKIEDRTFSFDVKTKVWYN